MNEKYLSEEKYQHTNKTVKMIAGGILAFALVIGLSLILLGYSNYNKNIKNQRSESEVTEELQAAQQEYNSLSAKSSNEFINNGYSQEYANLQTQLSTARQKVQDLQSELSDIKFGTNKMDAETSSIPLYMFGGFIIVAGSMISLSVFLMSKRREIMSYTIQQTMPVAQEGIEKMAPTVGKASGEILKGIAPAIKEVSEDIAPIYGKVAKEVSKGIKEGLKEEEKKEEEKTQE